MKPLKNPTAMMFMMTKHRRISPAGFDLGKRIKIRRSDIDWILRQKHHLNFSRDSLGNNIRMKFIRI
jgi:hypothetical protein